MSLKLIPLYRNSIKNTMQPQTVVLATWEDEAGRQQVKGLPIYTASSRPSWATGLGTAQ